MIFAILFCYAQAFNQYGEIAKRDEEFREQQKQKLMPAPEQVKEVKVNEVPSKKESSSKPDEKSSSSECQKAKPDGPQPKSHTTEPNPNSAQAKPVQNKEVKPAEDKGVKSASAKSDDEDADPELTRFVFIFKYDKWHN